MVTLSEIYNWAYYWEIKDNNSMALSWSLKENGQ